MIRVQQEAFADPPRYVYDPRDFRPSLDPYPEYFRIFGKVMDLVGVESYRAVRNHFTSVRAFVQISTAMRDHIGIR